MQKIESLDSRLRGNDRRNRF